MRAIFSSSRVETAEGVAAFLRRAGIEVLLRHGRSYHSRRSGQFSYLQPVSSAEELPSVWVCHSADQTRARTLLLQANLVESTRSDWHGTDQGQDVGTYLARPRWQGAIRLGMLTLIIIGLGFLILRPRGHFKPITSNRHHASDHLHRVQDERIEDKTVVRVHLQNTRAPQHQ